MSHGFCDNYDSSFWITENHDHANTNKLSAQVEILKICHIQLAGTQTCLTLDEIPEQVSILKSPKILN